VCANRESGEQILGPKITIALSKAEGWYDRKSESGKPASKWPTMPELMLRYRAASWMIDTTAPELTMGIGTLEEHIDTGELLDSMIEETQRRQEEKVRNMPPAFPGPLASSEDKESIETNKPPEIHVAEAASSSKQAPKPKANATAAPSTQAGNQTYAESEPNPFATGELGFKE